MTSSRLLPIALLLAALSACKGDSARRLPIWVPPLPDGSVALPDCVDRARWIYVVDATNRLLRFEPTTLEFHEVSTQPLRCPASVGASPFSMAVDRDAVAWILYSDGSIQRASTVDGRCTASAYVPNQQGMSLFGMGFASVDSLSPDERLHVAGPSSSGSTLARIDVGSLQLALDGPIVGTPELTGNALAQLWAFFPDTVPPKIAELDRASGAELQTYDLSTLGPDVLTNDPPFRWAFAFWGGDYYVFYQTQTEPSTSVYRLRLGSGGATASFTRVLADTGRAIVGAGVSTCVPYVLE